MKRVNIVIGDVIGRLTVESPAPYQGPYRAWACRCECGQTCTVLDFRLKGLVTKSCGCLQRERRQRGNRTHGHSVGGRRSPEYSSWYSMKKRCLDPNKAHIYGGVGVCERWMLFENFIADMGPKPTPKHSIDRIDNSKGYSPENCRWATPHEQGQNKRNNVNLDYKGKSVCMSELARIAGLDKRIVRYRVKQGFDAQQIVEKAWLKPV